MAKSDFYSRFGIAIDAKEAQRRFVNRVYNRIFDEHMNERAAQRPDLENKFSNSLADFFGERVGPLGVAPRDLTQRIYRLRQSFSPCAVEE